MNTAIIVAAGSGSRFESDTPKQFIEINGKAVVVYSLEAFVSCENVDEIILVISEDRIDEFSSRWDISRYEKPIVIVAGGDTRAESVKNGLDAAHQNTDIVLVHDGARPMITAEEIGRVIRAAVETGAACLTAPVTDTIKIVENGLITHTVDRRMLRRAMTPQAFQFSILKKAFDSTDLSESVTDECYLVERLGQPIASVPGGTRNIKITHPEDLGLAAAYLLDSKDQ